MAEKENKILTEEKQEEKEEKLSFSKKESSRKSPAQKAYSKPSVPKKKYKILGILGGNTFALEDEKGNGLRGPIPEGHKNAKIGDIIEL